MLKPSLHGKNRQARRIDGAPALGAGERVCGAADLQQDTGLFAAMSGSENNEA